MQRAGVMFWFATAMLTAGICASESQHAQSWKLAAVAIALIVVGAVTIGAYS